MRIRVAQFVTLTMMLTVAGHPCPAQQQPQFPPGARQMVDEVRTWDIRTVQYSKMFWQVVFGTDDLTSVVPALPQENDDAAKWRETVREHTTILQKHLSSRIAGLPPGTLFLLDPASGTLVTRASQEVMQNLNFIAELQDHLQPQSMTFELEVLEAPARLMDLNFPNEAFDEPEELSRTLRNLKADKHTKLRTRVQWHALPEERIMMRTGRELERAWRLVLHRDGTIEPMTWHCGLDTNVEAEATFAPRGNTINLLFDLKHHELPSQPRDLLLGQVAGILKLVQPVF